MGSSDPEVITARGAESGAPRVEFGGSVNLHGKNKKHYSFVFIILHLKLSIALTCECFSQAPGVITESRTLSSKRKREGF